MGRESMLNKKPMLLVLAGPNGSGKSTITHYFEIAGKSGKSYETERKCIVEQVLDGVNDGRVKHTVKKPVAESREHTAGRTEHI